jgi:outer membrane lipoprotein LolB
MIQSTTSRVRAPRARRDAVRPSRLLAVLALVVAVAACAPAPIRPSGAAGDDAAQARREQALAAQPDWTFSGRVAVSQAGDGGSARIDWTQRGQDYEIRLAAPVTRQSWRLSRTGGLARLEGLDGGPREGADAEALLLEATGWRLPVDRLAAWVRGARAPGAAELSSDPLGRPALIRQDGWTVEYRGWDEATPARPLRVFADRDTARVRLVVERWSIP